MVGSVRPLLEPEDRCLIESYLPYSEMLLASVCRKRTTIDRGTAPRGGK